MEQLPGNTDEPIGLSMHAMLRPRRRGFACDCGKWQQPEADFEDIFVFRTTRNARKQNRRRAIIVTDELHNKTKPLEIRTSS